MQKTLRLASWNVLAPSLVRRNPRLYQACAPAALAPDARRERILLHLTNIGADVIALQEVEDFEKTLAPSLKELGYEGVFKKRTGDETTDGVAIFARSSRVSITSVEALEFAALADEPPLASRIVGDASEAADSEPASAVIVAARNKLAADALKHNVALLVTLRDNETGQSLLVGCTHILFNHNRGLVKLSQVDAYLTGAMRLAAAAPSPPAVVLMGDFNSAPRSLLHTYMSGGGVNTFLDTEGEWDGCRRFSATEKGRRNERRKSGALRVDAPAHPLARRLRSAYDSMGEPAATTCVDGDIKTVDYIMVERGRLEVEALLPTPTRGQMAKYGSLPHVKMPSDHVPLACDVRLRSARELADGEATMRPVTMRIDTTPMAAMTRPAYATVDACVMHSGGAHHTMKWQRRSFGRGGRGHAGIATQVDGGGKGGKVRHGSRRKHRTVSASLRSSSTLAEMMAARAASDETARRDRNGHRAAGSSSRRWREPESSRRGDAAESSASQP